MENLDNLENEEVIEAEVVVDENAEVVAPAEAEVAE